MKTRVIAAAVLLPLLLIAVLFLPKIVTAVIFGALAAIAAYELLYRTDLVKEVRLVAYSAVIAFGLQWLLYTAVARGIGTSDSLQILTVIPFEQIWQPVALVFLGAGILVGVGGSLTAIRRFLRV